MTKAGRNQFCCYVLECDNEVGGKNVTLNIYCTITPVLSYIQTTVRIIYTSLNEVFQRLKLQQEAKAREQEEEPGVRPQMLRRLSTSKKTDGPESRREREEQGSRVSLNARRTAHTAGADTPHFTLDPPPVGHRATTSNAPTNHITVHTSPIHTSSFHSPVADEIDRQFSSVFTPPTSPTTTTTSLQHPKVKRISREEDQTRNPARHQDRSFQPSQQLQEENAEDDEESDELSVELQSPLQASHGHQHDGNVRQQQLEDTTGVQVGDKLNILVPKRDARPSLVMQNGHSIFSPPPALQLQQSSNKKQPPHSPPPNPVVKSPSELLAMMVSLKLFSIMYFIYYCGLVITQCRLN